MGFRAVKDKIKAWLDVSTSGMSPNSNNWNVSRDPSSRAWERLWNFIPEVEFGFGGSSDSRHPAGYPSRRVSNGTSGLVVTAWNLLGMAGNSKILKCWVFYGTGRRSFIPSLFSSPYPGKGSQEAELNKFQDVGLAHVVTAWNHLGLVGNSKILKYWVFHEIGRMSTFPSLFSSLYPGKSSQQEGEWNKFRDVGPWWPWQCWDNTWTR